ncbi:hypothetical protein EGR_10743 [Echinococcus granulosus]|uniref:Uncharacterized protein n=1 Tax=Echinococcus granulosus TaxID=6210 RepID=W6TZY7_ECHGR|nr:hypothetical protein EGR_10743 [Echinococcus granulosus]EUB54400.1 hypothetical protein EGR_10743 [Echinococcus granulosus]
MRNERLVVYKLLRSKRITSYMVAHKGRGEGDKRGTSSIIDRQAFYLYASHQLSILLCLCIVICLRLLRSPNPHPQLQLVSSSAVSREYGLTHQYCRAGFGDEDTA